MAITIKSEREIELMAEAGKILERVHNELENALRPGMSTKDIDTLGEEIIRSYGCIPSFLNYNGYPASICVSVIRKLFMEFRINTGSFRKAILSVWTQELFIRAIIQMRQERMRSVKSVRKQKN